MAKSLHQLGAGEGHVLPDPVVAPVTSPGQGVAASPTRIVEADGVHLGTGGNVAWIRDTDGVLVAELTAYIDPAGSTLTFVRALDSVGNRAAVVANATETENYVSVTAGRLGAPIEQFALNVLADNGSSDLVRKTSWLTGQGLAPEITAKHWGAATPTGGQSGDIAVGNGVIWVNDAGTWKSAPVT